MTINDLVGRQVNLLAATSGQAINLALTTAQTIWTMPSSAQRVGIAFVVLQNFSVSPVPAATVRCGSDASGATDWCTAIAVPASGIFVDIPTSPVYSGGTTFQIIATVQATGLCDAALYGFIE